MTNAKLLMEFYGKIIIPLDVICADFFRHLTPAKLIHKASRGEIALPICRIEASQKCAKGVHVNHLAAYLDRIEKSAAKEAQAMVRGEPETIG